MDLSLKEKIKALALSGAEDHLKLALKQIKEIGALLVADSSNPFDDVAFKGILMFEEQLNQLIDKVDGQVG